MATEAVGSNCAAIPMSGKQALPVLAQGERWVVIAKPSGMVLHPSHYPGQFRDTVVQVAAAQFGRPVHAVHRLDAATSGTLLLAFDAETVAEREASAGHPSTSGAAPSNRTATSKLVSSNALPASSGS